MDMIKFLSKRKKENRQSLIIDNFNVDLLNEKLAIAQRRNSFSDSTNDSNLSIESSPDNSRNYNDNPRNYNDNPRNDNNNSRNDNNNSRNDNNNSRNYNDDSRTYNNNNNSRNYNDDSRTYNDNKWNENDSTRNFKEKENEILNENYNNISKVPQMNRYDKPVVSGIQESEYYNSRNSYDNVNNSNKRQEHDEHTCKLCYNKQDIKDSFMILTCGHIFHIRCLVDSHYTDANKCGVIDEDYFNSRICCVCSSRMEMEDILYIHNKFYKNTKEYIVRQDETIEKLDKQMTKLKEELRTCYEYKQKLEHQREKSRQITVTINTMI